MTGKLTADAQVPQAAGTAKPEAVIDLVEVLTGIYRVTEAMGKHCDTKGLMEVMRSANTAPHIARNATRRISAIHGRTTRHLGYQTSQSIRKRIEKCFG